MNLSIAVFLCGACALGCARESAPPTVPAASATPPPPSRVDTAQVAESAPPEPGIPKDAPPLAPPAPPLATPPDQTPLTLTPAAGTGAPRTSSAALVPSDPTRDKPESAQDKESIREIRELLAADKSVAAISNQVTIVAKQGRVSLRGQVNTAAQRAAIEKAARQAVGVTNVKNELVVME